MLGVHICKITGVRLPKPNYGHVSKVNFQVWLWFDGHPMLSCLHLVYIAIVLINTGYKILDSLLFLRIDYMRNSLGIKIKMSAPASLNVSPMNQAIQSLHVNSIGEAIIVCLVFFLDTRLL